MSNEIKFPLVIDISSRNGIVDWKNVHPLPNLVICRASEGGQCRDNIFPVHWNNLKHESIKKGASHVFDPTGDGQQQAENFISAMAHAGGFDENSIAPIVDATHLQWYPRKTPGEKRIRQFLDEIESHFDQVPIIMINRRYWNFLKARNANLPSWSDDYLLWVPWYPKDQNIFQPPSIETSRNAWENCTIGRYDECAEISGIKGYVTLSTLSPSYAAQIGIDSKDTNPSWLGNRKLNIEATIVASEGVIIRGESLLNSKMLAFLSKGSMLTGVAVEFVNEYEAWLQVTKPVSGWCPIVRTGRIYLSVWNASQRI